MWDEMYQKGNVAWGHIPATFLQEIIDKIPNKSRILDLGCGAGRNSKLLFDKGHTVTGIDSSIVAIEKARELCNATFLQEDLITNDWIDQKFDVVLDFGFLHSWPKEEKLLEYRYQLDNVLEIGGLYVGEQSKTNLRKDPLGGSLYAPPYMEEKEFMIFGGYKEIIFRNNTLPPHDGCGIYPCYQMLLERVK